MLLFNRQPRSSIAPVIRWTGSKRSQAEQIAAYIPSHNRYFEPFVGGGSLLYLMAKPDSVAGDIYKPLIDLWNVIQNSHKELVVHYRDEWAKLQANRPNYYYEVRDRFNDCPNPYDLNFLTRTCVNAIIRFNSKGEFNTSFHLTRPGIDPDSFAVIANRWHEVVQGVSFVCQDYSTTLSEARRGDFVYLDPPYAGDKVRYIESLNVDKLFDELEGLNSKEVKWAMSFDGTRGDTDLTYKVPEELYSERVMLSSGYSRVAQVLNKSLEHVHETLYLSK